MIHFVNYSKMKGSRLLNFMSRDEYSVASEEEEDIIEQMKTELQEKQIELSNQTQKLVLAVSHTRSLKMKLNAYETEMEIQKEKYNALMEESQQKTESVDKMRKQLKEMESIVKDSNDEVHRVVELYKMMESKFGKELKRVQEAARKSRISAAEEQRTMKQKLLKLQSENDSLKIAITEYEAINSSMVDDKHECERENQILHEELDELKQRIHESESDSASDDDECAKLASANQALMATNRQLEDRLNALMKELSAAKGDSSHENIFLSPRKPKASAMEISGYEESMMRDNRSLLEEITQLRRENQRLIEQNRSFRNEEEDLIESMIGVNKSLINDVRRLKKENRALISENNEIPSDLSEGEIASAGDSDATREEIEILHNSFNLAEQFDKVCCENQELQDMVDHLRDKISEQTSENERLIKENEELRKELEIASGASALKQVRKMSYILDNNTFPDETPNTDELTSIKSENATLKDLVTAFDSNNQCIDLTMKVKEWAQMFSISENRVHELEDERAEMKERVEKADAIIKEVESLRKQLMEKEATNEFYTETAIMNHRIIELENALAKKGVFDDEVVNNLQDQVEYLQNELDRVTLDRDRLKNQLQLTGDYIEEEEICEEEEEESPILDVSGGSLASDYDDFV